MFVHVSPHLSVRRDGVWHAITFADVRNGTPAAVCGVAPPAWETDRVTPDGEAVIAPWPPYASDGRCQACWELTGRGGVHRVYREG